MADIIVDSNVPLGLLNHIRARDNFESQMKYNNAVLEERRRSNKAQEGFQRSEIDIAYRTLQDQIKRHAALNNLSDAQARNFDASTQRFQDETHRLAMADTRDAAARARVHMSKGDEASARASLVGALRTYRQEFDENAPIEDLMKKAETYSAGGNMLSLYESLSGAMRNIEAPGQKRTLSGDVEVPDSIANAEMGAQQQGYLRQSATLLEELVKTNFAGDIDAALGDPEFVNTMKSLAEADPTIREILRNRTNVSSENADPKLQDLGDSGGHMAVTVNNVDGNRAPITQKGSKAAENPDDPAIALSPGDLYNFFVVGARGRDMIEPAFEAVAANTAPVGGTVESSAIAALLGQQTGALDQKGVANVLAGRPASSEAQADAASVRRITEQQLTEQRAEEAEQRRAGRAQAVHQQRRAEELNDTTKQSLLEYDESIEERTARVGDLVAGEAITIMQDMRDKPSLIGDALMTAAGISDFITMKNLTGGQLKERLQNPWAAYDEGWNLTRSEKDLPKDEQRALSFSRDFEKTFRIPRNAELLAKYFDLRDHKGRVSTNYQDWNPKSRAEAQNALMLIRAANDRFGTVSEADIALAAEGLHPERSGVLQRYIQDVSNNANQIAGEYAETVGDATGAVAGGLRSVGADRAANVFDEISQAHGRFGRNAKNFRAPDPTINTSIREDEELDDRRR